MLNQDNCSRLRIIKEVRKLKDHYDFTAHDLCNMTGLTFQQISKFMDYPNSYDYHTMNVLVELLNTPMQLHYYPHSKRYLLLMPNKSDYVTCVPLDYVYKVAEW